MLPRIPAKSANARETGKFEIGILSRRYFRQIAVNQVRNLRPGDFAQRPISHAPERNTVPNAAAGPQEAVIPLHGHVEYALQSRNPGLDTGAGALPTVELGNAPRQQRLGHWPLAGDDLLHQCKELRRIVVFEDAVSVRGGGASRPAFVRLWQGYAPVPARKAWPLAEQVPRAGWPLQAESHRH